MIIGLLGSTGMAWVDIMMVGRGVGTEALAGLAFGVNILHVWLVAGFGLVAAVSVLTARAHGAGDPREIRQVLRHGAAAGCVFAVLLACGLTLGIDGLRLFGQEEAVVAIAKPYVVINAWGYLFLLQFAVLRAFCEAQDRPWLPLQVLFCGLGLNIFLNWIFIFGNLGVPRMEVTGAAIATVLSHLFCLLFLVWRVGRHPWLGGDGWHFLRPRHLDWKSMRQLLAIGIPTCFQLLFEVGAFAAAAIMMGWIGATTLAAHQVALSLASMSFMVPLGFSFAVAIRVGQAAGRGNQHQVRRVSFSSLGFSAVYMLVMAALFIALRHQLPVFFTKDPVVIALAAQLILVVGLFQLFDGIQVTNLGILRGLKDVRIPTILLLVAYWAICLPGGYLFAFIFRWEGLGIWIGLALGLFVVAAALTARTLHTTRQRDAAQAGKQ